MTMTMTMTTTTMRIAAKGLAALAP
jgi:hypothetical protein